MLSRVMLKQSENKMPTDGLFHRKITQEMHDQILEVIAKFDGKMTIPEAIGVLEIIKQGILASDR